MPLIDVSVAHGQTLEVAQRRLETLVQEASQRFGIRAVEWSADRRRVKLEASSSPSPARLLRVSAVVTTVSPSPRRRPAPRGHGFLRSSHCSYTNRVPAIVRIRKGASGAIFR
jgi:hypothetical protein